MNYKKNNKKIGNIFAIIMVFTIFVSNIPASGINVLISKFNNRKIVDSLWLAQNDDNVVDVSFADKAEAATISQYAGGLLVYADETVGTPKYRTFNDANGFDAEQSASSVGASAIEWIRVAASPTADEWIIVTRDAGDVIKAQVCVGITGGISCGAPTTISATAGTHGLRNFDVAYEQTSGDALLVYGTSTADQLKKIEWVGGVWTNDAVITTTRTSGTVEWVELTSKNSSDEIGIAYSDTNDDVSAYKWSGTAIGNEATAVITATASTGDVRKFDVSFEGVSGDMLVVAWVQGAGTAATGQLVGTTWTIGTQTAVDMLTGFVDLQEPSPSSNYIVASTHGAVASANPSEGFAWTGSAVSDGTAADDVAQNWAANYQLSAVQYFSNSTYYAVSVVSNAATADDIDWWTSSSTGALTNRIVNTRTRGATRFLDLFDYPNANKVLLLTSDANSDLWADTWDGATVTDTSWVNLTSGGAIDTSLSTATTDVVDFAFRLAPLLEAPPITTPTKTSIGINQATLGANITSDGGDALSARGICIGTSPSPTNCTSSGTSTGVFTQTVGSLNPNTLYYYRGYATNSIGTNYTIDDSFTTQTLPTITSPTKSAIADTTATLGATLTSPSFTVTARGTCWGTSSSPTTNCLSGGTTTGAYTQGRTGLTAGTFYYYRGYATYTDGAGVTSTIYTTDDSFTTLTTPTVTTQAVSSINTTTATGNGNITVTGGENNTKRGFVYGVSSQSLPGNVAPGSSGYTSFVEDTGSYSTGAFTKTLTGLSVGLTYYVRAYSYNSVGYSYGEEVSFTVLSCSTTTSGLWSVGANWTACSGVGGIPAAGDSPSIISGVTITLDIDTPALDTLTINGVLTTANNGTSYTLNSNSINIGSTGFLYANNSTINLSATTGTPFTKTGVFDAGTSTVNMVGGQDWTSLSSAGTHGWFGITTSYDGTKIAAGGQNASSYVYTSTDSGTTWTQRTSSGVRKWIVFASSSDGAKLVGLVENGYVYVSSDSGATWVEKTSLGIHGWWGAVVSSDGTKIAVASSDQYFYTSTDGGDNWNDRSANAGAHGWSSLTSSTDGTKLAASTFGGYIYTSTDFGVTWSERTSSGLHNWRDIASSSDGTKLVALGGGYGNNDYIYTSTDSGATWTQRTSAGLRGWISATISSDGVKISAVVNGGYVYLSSDSGANWTQQPSVGSSWWASSAASIDGNIIYGTDNGGYIYKYKYPQNTTISSGSPSFYNLTISGTGTRSLGEALIANNILTVSGGTLDTTSANNYTVNSGNVLINGGTFNSNASTVNLTGTSGTLFTKSSGIFNTGTSTVNAVGGQDWTERNSMGPVVWRDMTSSSDGTKLAAVGYSYYIYTSTDSGATWTQRASAGQRYWASITSSSDGTKLAAVVNGGGGYIYTSNDSGVTWTERVSSGQHTWYKIASSSDGNKLVAVVDNGYIYTSTDSGETWTERTGAGSRNWRGVTSSSDGTKLVVVGNMTDIYTSTDSGVSWVDRYNSKYWTNVASSSDGTKLAATAIASSYVYTSTDSGANWTAQINSGLHDWYGIASSSDGTKLAAVFNGGNIYTSIDSGINWSDQISSGQRAWKTISSSSDGAKLVAGTDGSGAGGYIYTYSAPQNLTLSSGSPSFNNLTISGTGTRSLGESLTATGTLTSSGGILDTTSASSYTVNAGKVLINGGAFNPNASTVNLTSTSGTLFTKSSGTFNSGTSTISLASSSGTPTVASGIASFYNLSTTGAGTFTLGEVLNVSNLLTITGGTLNTSATNYTVNAGNLLINGGTFTPNASTINLSGNSGTLFAKSSGTFNYGTSTVNAVGGQDWTSQTSSGSRTWISMASSSDGVKLVAGTNGNYIYTSTDSGATWISRAVLGGWQGVTSSSDGTKLAAVNANNSAEYIYTSTDSGVTWTQQTASGARNWTSIASSYDGTKLAAVSWSGYVYTSTDSGATWVERTASGSRWWTGITSSYDGTKLAAVASSGYIYTSTDSGATWVERTASGSRYWNGITSSSDGAKLAAVVSSGYIYTSTDSGATWTEITTLGSRGWYKVASSSDGTKLVLGDYDSGYIYTSSDSGATWTQQTSAGQRSWYAFASSTDGTKLAAGAYGNYIYTYKAPQNVTVSSGSPSFNNLTISGTGTRSLGEALTVNNILTVTGGTLDTSSIGSYTINTGYVLINGGALNTNASILKINGTSGILFNKVSGVFTAGVGSLVQLLGGGNSIVSSGSPTFSYLTIAGSGTKSLGENLEVIKELILAGSVIFDTTTNNYSVNTGKLSPYSGSLVLNNSTVNLSDTGIVFNYLSGTITPGTSTIKLTDSSSSSKTFSGGGQTYNNVWFAPGAGTGSLTITGNNTFNNFKDDGTAAHSILFTTGSTQTFNSWNVSGTAGNLITINSTDTGTHNLVMANGGYADVDYLNIQHSVATPSNTWYAGDHSVNNQAVATIGSGWIFTAKPLIKTYELSGFRFFNNINNADIGGPLSSANTLATLNNSGDNFRLRTLLHVGGSNLPINFQNFKLQYSQMNGTCDALFSGESYSDVTNNSDIAYYDNFYPEDKTALIAHVNDPTHNADTIVNQSYVESNNFTNSIAEVPINQDGKWDFSLYDKSVSNNTSYCLRIVKSDGGLLDTYSFIPQIITAVYKSRGGGGGNVDNSATPDSPTGGGGSQSGGSSGGESSSATNSPGTMTDDSSMGTAIWNNTTNIASSDNSYANSIIMGGYDTHYLSASNFGFNIPVNATIDGILVEIEKSATEQYDNGDSEVKIIKSNGSYGSLNKSLLSTWPIGDAYYSYGGETDLWSESWTASDINDSNFGVVISAWSYFPGEVFMNIDHIKITVYYTTEGEGNSELDIKKCSDGIDNDGDTLIDTLDPNCHVGDNLGNPYLPNYDSEAPVVTPCTVNCSGGGGTGDLGYNKNIFNSIFNLLKFKTFKDSLLGLVFNPFRIQ